ncbi:YqhR family membrane protein [Paenibacillus sp. YYML68]|uniref:YqhR family membrane protein n=1 Tax=Paenibacillus sp. YYML68 TaxID=2909250 RepID=UPI002493117D|nr:YqhR family membrane protein [Paenibacillus sp. YYML68]
MKKSEDTVKPRTNKWMFGLYVGFFAGLIWGGLKIVESYFRFTSLTPGFMLEPFFKHSFLLTWQGYMLGWATFIAMSIVAALIYVTFLLKLKGPWPGLVYGVAWWSMIYLLVGPLTGMITWIVNLDLNTIITDLCLFALWGLFIGYSIAFEFTDERVYEPFKTKGNSPDPA